MDFTSFLAFNGADSGSPTTTDMIISTALNIAFTAYGLVMMRDLALPSAATATPRQTAVPAPG
jgi:hypothetical protein